MTFIRIILKQVWYGKKAEQLVKTLIVKYIILKKIMCMKLFERSL